MIIFDLLCSCGCQFEGWFRDRDDFQAQQREGILRCPSCGDENIRKILSPVAFRKASPGRKDPEPHCEGEKPGIETEQFSEMLKAVSKYVVTHFDDVGTRLAEESLKIHFGIAEPRNIRGVASKEEEKMLKQEGIELLKIPCLPEEEKLN